MALEFAKELLGDAYTGELEEKLEAKINELYAPKADLDAASARADGLQERDAYLFGPAAAEPAPASGTGTSAVPGTAKYTADEIAMRKAADLPVD